MKNNIIIEKKKLSDIFPKQVFWDVDLDKFSLENSEDKSFIIQRVLKMSYLQDNLLQNLESLFSVDEIKYYAKGSHEILGNERIEKICERYKMKPSNFPHYFKNIENFMYA